MRTTPRRDAGIELEALTGAGFGVLHGLIVLAQGGCRDADPTGERRVGRVRKKQSFAGVRKPGADMLAEEPFGPRHGAKGERGLFVELRLGVEDVRHPDAPTRTPGVLVEQTKIAIQRVDAHADFGPDRSPQRRSDCEQRAFGNAAGGDLAWRAGRAVGPPIGPFPRVLGRGRTENLFHLRRGGGRSREMEIRLEPEPIPGRHEIGQRREGRIIVHSPEAGDRGGQNRVGVAPVLDLPELAPANRVGRPHRGLVAAQDVARARRAIAGVGGVRDRTAPPFVRLEQGESGAVVRIEPHEHPPSVGLAPPEGRVPGKRRAAAVVIDSHEKPVHAPVQEPPRAGTGKPVDVVLNCHRWSQLAPQILRHPPHHRVPLRRVQKWGLVEGQGGHIQNAFTDRFEELATTLGRRGLPPVRDRQGGFGRPTEPLLGGTIEPGENRVERNVQIAPVQLARHGRMVREADVRVAEMDEIQFLDESRRRFLRPSQAGAHEENRHRPQTEPNESGAKHPSKWLHRATP